jgi:hypothetical protein
MIINVTDPNKEKEPEQPSVAEEMIGAIKLAREEFKSCEVVTDFKRAKKFLMSCGYGKQIRDYKDGIIVQFEKAQIYVHEHGPAEARALAIAEAEARKRAR